METEIVRRSDPVPVPVLVPVLAPAVDTTTLAVLEFLFSQDFEVKTEAWHRLVKILFCTIKARRGSHRLFLPQGDIRFRDTATAGDPDEREPTTTSWRRDRHRDNATKLFLEDWLTVKLNPFYGQSKEEIQSAADGGTFRYWGGDCKNDLKDELRHRRAVRKNSDAVKYSSKTSVDPDPLDTHPDRIDRPISAEDEDSELWCDRLPSNAPLPGEEDNRHIERDRLLRFIAEHAAELGDLATEMTAHVDCYFPEDENAEDVAKGDVTRRIAELRKVSLVQARTYKRRFLQIAEDRTKNDDPPHPALREFFDLLEKRTTVPNADKER